MSATRVEIVRPKRANSDVFAEWLGAHVADAFVSAWLLMLLLPLFSHWHPSYWQAFAGYLAARVIFPVRQSLDSWSRKSSK